MVDALLDALVDTGKLLPILFLTYLLMEYLEHHAGGGISRCLQRSRGAGPALGAALGLVPQCGFSGAGGGGCRVFGPLSQLRGFGSADKPVRPGDYGTGPYAVGAHGQCRCGSAGFVPGEPEPEGELDGGGAFTSVRYPTGKRFRPAFRRNFVRL